MIRAILPLLLTVGLSACGGGSDKKSNSKPVVISPPVSSAKIIGDIEFEDEFIKNCVMMFDASRDSVTGELVLTHRLVDVNNLWHEDYRDTSVQAVKSLGGCNGYNSFNELNMASTLADLRHFPNLKTLLLDFDSSNWQSLAEMTQIESVNIYNTNLTDLSIVTRLPNLKKLQVWPELSDWSFLRYAERLEGFATPYVDKETFTGFRHLPTSVTGIHFHGKKLDQSMLSELDRFTNLAGLSLRFNEYDEALDLSVLGQLQKLARLYLYQITIDDLSFLNAPELQSVHFEISSSFDPHQLDRFTKLRSVYLVKRGESGPFVLDYNDSDSTGALLGQPVDTVYAKVVLKGIALDPANTNFKFSRDPETDIYTLYDIPNSEFVNLIQLWLSGHIEFV